MHMDYISDSGINSQLNNLLLFISVFIPCGSHIIYRQTAGLLVHFRTDLSESLSGT